MDARPGLRRKIIHSLAARLSTGWLVVVLAFPSHAVDTGTTSRKDSLIQPYEPVTAGYTKDSDDVPYVDVTLSLKFPLLPPRWTDPNGLFLAFTGRFGFYWGTRDSSPVIGKSYNPKLIWRFVSQPADTRRRAFGGGADDYAGYLDLAYAHQSNGQTISSAEQYQAEEAKQRKPYFANEYISRGWDYLEAVWKRSYGQDLSSYLDLRFFLHDGLLQGHPEEFNSWEPYSEGKPRRAVDGLTGMLEYEAHRSPRPFGILLQSPSLWLKYQTGYGRPFEFSTVRAEAGAIVLELPVVIWAQRGYMSDLANYYRKTTSYGIELRFGSF